MRKTCSAILCLVMLSGCIRPNYVQQYVPTPESWRMSTDESSTLCNEDWWQQFNDPVLDDLIHRALRNNQDIKVAISRVLEFYADYRIEGANLYPFVTGQAAFTRTRNSQATPFAFPPGINPIYNNWQATFNLAWQLDFWGQIQNATEAAFADFIGTIEARRAVVLTVVASVANAYIVLRQLDAQLIVSKQTLESRKESLRLAVERFNLGETSELEVRQAQSEVEDAAIRVLTYERDIPIQEDLLSILVGENPHDIIRGTSIDNFMYPVTIPAGLPSDLLTRRPDIMAAEDALIAANARVAEARTFFFPQFSLTGFYGSQSARLKEFATSPARIWQYIFGLSQPIYNSGQIYYEVQAALAIRDEALHTYRETILKAFQEVNDALFAVQKNRELVKEHQIQVAVLKDYYHLSTLRYQEGEVDYLNVLDAERQLFRAQLDLVQSQADSFTAIVNLYSALGGGWVDEADAEAISPKGCCECEE